MEADRPSPELPTEIIFSQILPRLPPDILKWYNLVCKSWCSLIRSPYFVTAYRNFPRCRTNLLFEKLEVRERGRRFFSSQIDQKENPSSVAELFKLPWIPNVQSTNGLLCVTVDDSVEEPGYIYNPSTGKSIKLPHNQLQTDGKASSARYYFGFSPLTNEYKVLQILLLFDLKGLGTCLDIVFNTFTLGTDSWRPLQIDLADLPFEIADHREIITSHAGIRNESVCLNGAIHWIYEKQNSIVVFDVGDERFRVIPLPEDYEGHEPPQNVDDDVMRYTRKMVPGIVEVGGCVGVFLDKSWEQNVMELWILKDYQNHAWVKETIPLMSILILTQYGRYGCSWYINALCTIYTGELALVLVYFGGSPGYDNGEPELHLYNMKTKQYRKQEFIFPNEAVNRSREDPIYLITSYEDSIVPLN